MFAQLAVPLLGSMTPQATLLCCCTGHRAPGHLGTWAPSLPSRALSHMPQKARLRPERKSTLQGKTPHASRQDVHMCARTHTHVHTHTHRCTRVHTHTHTHRAYTSYVASQHIKGTASEVPVVTLG